MGASLASYLLPVVLLGSSDVGAGAASESVAARVGRVEAGLRPAILIEGQAPERFRVEERMRFYKTPGVGVAVINGGVVEWAKGYGVREAGTSEPVTPETVFQAASISKPVAAVVALKLVEEGKLKLDEDVNGKLTSWKVPDNAFTAEKKVTLRRLLGHRAGLADRAGFVGTTPAEPPPTLREILESGKWTPAPVRIGFEPGSRFAYSGGGYCVVEQLLEDVTGKPFPVLARETTLQPLEMTNSSFDQFTERPNAAAGHDENGKRLAQKWNVYAATSAAGLWATPADLARFAVEIQKSAAGESDRALSRSMAAEMLTLVAGEDDRESKLVALMEAFPEKPPSGRGLGFGLMGRPPTRFFHTGSNPGYQCELQAYVGDGNGAIVMTNSAQGWRLGREILWAVAEEYGWPDYDYTPEFRRVAPVPPEAVARCVGRYRIALRHRADEVAVERAGDRLFVRLPGASARTELFAESETVFFSVEDAVTLTFVGDSPKGAAEVVSDHGWRAKRDEGGE